MWCIGYHILLNPGWNVAELLTSRWDMNSSNPFWCCDTLIPEIVCQNNRVIEIDIEGMDIWELGVCSSMRV